MSGGLAHDQFAGQDVLLRLGLLGVSSRRAAFGYLWASLLTSAACMVGGLYDSRLIVGVPLFFFMMFEKWFLVPLPKGPIEAMFGF